MMLERKIEVGDVWCYQHSSDTLYYLIIRNDGNDDFDNWLAYNLRENIKYHVSLVSRYDNTSFQQYWVKLA